MIRKHVVKSLRNLAKHLDETSIDSEWYLFGSTDRNATNASDVDLMILCKDDMQADTLRKAIDPDIFLTPIHLSILTYAEATEVDAVKVQMASKIYP